MVSHSFERRPSSMYWDDKQDLAVFTYTCEERHSNPNMPPTVGMGGGGPPMGGGSEYCEAEKEVRYEIGSVKDDGDNHEGPYGYEMRDGENTYGDIVHKDTVDEVPAWVFEIINRAKAKVEDVNVGVLMTDPRGPEFDMMVVTGEGEYSVYLYKVGETVVE